MGFTLEKTKADFQASKLNQLELMNDANHGLQNFCMILILIRWKERFEEFLVAFRTIRDRRVSGIPCESVIQYADSPLIKRLFRNNYESFDFFPCEDLRLFVRAFTEACPEHALATYELTEIVQAGYYEPDDPIADMSIHALIGEYPRHGKIIILTEGKTDRRLLECALHLLYPHLGDYFSFMDFEDIESRRWCRRSRLTVKSFIASGIMNRVIALFDNDTAAAEALRSLVPLAALGNIKVMRLPDIDLARNYPALGPDGVRGQT